MSEFDHWIERWQQGMTGWHRGEVNPRLAEHGMDCLPEPPGTVFVPLCGASLDMLWLRQRGYRVTGVEISERAAQQFFTEAGIVAVTHDQGAFTRYSGDRVDIWVGDYFTLTDEILGPVDAVYDRAALIAMEARRRPDYARHLHAISGAAPVLLVTLEYDQPLMSGPPYSVREEEVRTLFGNEYQVELLIRDDVLAAEPRFRDRGLSSLHECVYRLSEGRAGN